ncbi:MAG: carboxypeptidase regulatory-like domain-containing protein [Candidatus Kerfeldbacteria bacterium]|nr:carboxypeptidase regulatory-like domain-containing protein [Candidatus Kerfeldbacteria bacterium]
MTLRWIRRGVFLVAALLLVLHFGNALPTAAAGETISGTLTRADGTTPVSGAYLYAHTADWMSYSTATTGTDGTYTLSLSGAGTYIVEVYAYDSTQSDPASQTVTITEGETETLNLSLRAPNLTLKVVDSLGAGISDVYVNVSKNNDWSFYAYANTAADGTASFYLTSSGTYRVTFYMPYGSSYSAPADVTFTYTDGETKNLGNISVQNPSMRGSVEDELGNPIVYASLSMYNAGWSVSKWTSTDTNGDFTMDAVPTGTYTLEVWPPYSGDGSSYEKPDNITVSLTNGTTNTAYQTTPIVMSRSRKTITGTVEHDDGTAVTGGFSVYGWSSKGGWIYDQVDSGNTFSMTAGTGTWNLQVNPNWYSYDSGSSPNWTYTGNPVSVEFTEAATVEETETAEFVVTDLDSRFNGTLELPDGTWPSGTYASIYAWSDSNKVWAYGNVDSDGSFSLKVAAGTYTISGWVGNGDYGFPDLGKQKIDSDATVDLGTISLSSKNATISVTVVDENSNVIEGAYVNMWSNTAGGWGWGQTDASGAVAVKVFPGEYNVDAFPAWEGDSTTHYVNIDAPSKVTVAEDETQTVTRTFRVASATINGFLQDGDGNAVTDVWGWISAEPAGTDNSNDFYGSGIGTSLSQGSFSLPVPEGDWELRAYVGWDSDYTVSDSPTVTVTDGETSNGNAITVLANSVTVQGNVVDGDGNDVTNPGYVSIFLENGSGGYKYGWANYNDGSYSISTAPGTWNISYHVDGYNSDYIPMYDRGSSFTAEENETVTYDLVVALADSTIEGVVTDPDGNPIENALISVSTTQGGQSVVEDESPFSYWTERANLTDVNGYYSLKVPEGAYFVSVSIGGQDYLPPAAQTTTASPAAAVTVGFQFVEPDASYAGTLTLDGEAVPGYVTGYSENGQSVSAETEDDGTFSFDVIGDQTWTFSAVYEDGDNNLSYETASFEVEVGADEDVTGEEVELDDTASDLSNAQTYTWDAGTQKHITTESGLEIDIPANAITSEDVDVSLTVTPTVEVPEQSDAVALGESYDFVVVYASGNSTGTIITDFDSSVTITIPVDPDTLPDGFDLDQMSTRYVDESTNRNRPTDNVTIDTSNSELYEATFTADHFTVFGLMAPPTNAEGEEPEVIEPSEPEENAPGDPGSPDDGAPTPNDPAITDHDLILSPSSGGGAHYRVFDESGDVLGSFFAYGEGLVAPVRSGFHGVGADLDGDGELEIVTTPGAGMGDHVRAFTKYGTYLGSVFAIDPGFRGGLNLAAADMNNDGDDEIVVIPELGRSNLRVLDFNAEDSTFDLLDWTFVFDEGYQSGSFLTTGDYNGDNRMDVAISTSDDSGNVQVYELTEDNELERLDGFWAYDEGFSHGVRLASGDLDGNGTSDLLTTTEQGTSHLRAFTYNTETEVFELMAQTFVYDDNFTYGMTVASADMDGDGKAEVAVAPKYRGAPNVQLFSLNSDNTEFSRTAWIYAYDEGMTKGVNLALVDVDDDNMAELITGTRSGITNTRIYDLETTDDETTLELQTWFMAFGDTFPGGVNVQY